MTDRIVGPPVGPDYGDYLATVVDAIRHGTSDIQDAEDAAEEALVRLRAGPEPLIGPTRSDRDDDAMLAAVARVVERAAAGALGTDEAAHQCLDRLRELGVAIPSRMPDDPFLEQ